MKKILSLVLTLAMLATLCVFGGATVSAAGTQWNGEAATAFSGGNGTAADPYQIGTAAELKLFANIVNGEGGQTQDKTICGILTADIVLNVGDVSGCNGTKADGWVDWTPIGTGDGYLGTFNGDGHTVSGVYVNTITDNVGFFGTIATGAVVSNLGVVNSYISGQNAVGGVVGFMAMDTTSFIGATVSNCYNTGTVSGNNFVGGVCGHLRSRIIEGCYNTGAVSGNDYVGGILGVNFVGSANGCYNIGTVSGTSNVGGVVGFATNGQFKSFYLDTCVITETTPCTYGGTPKTADEMKTQAFVDLLNENGGSFTYYIGKLPLQSWQPDPNIYGTAVTFNVAPVYIVTIPGEVTLGGTATVSAENVVLDEGKQLEVTLTGTSGDGNDFTVSNGKTTNLTYQVTDSASNAISVGGTVLTVNPADGASGSATLNFSRPEDSAIIYSGEYSGTVTFTVSVAD